MEKLFGESEIFQEKRPSVITAKQKEQMYVDIAKDIIKYRYSKSDIDTIIEDIKELSLNDSGYEMAKELEDGGVGEYEFDGSFIDFLESLSFRPYSILQENVEAWVRAHGIKPNLELGTRLIMNRKMDRNSIAGEIFYITGYIEERACYILNKKYVEGIGTLVTDDDVEKHSQIQS